MRWSFALMFACVTVLTWSCIRPRNYHQGQSTFLLRFQDTGQDDRHYFHRALVHEAYIEFDAQGHLFQPKQLDDATTLIRELRNGSDNGDKRLFLMVFVHGWKNNASEDSGNVWGFRRLLDQEAWRFQRENSNVLVMGVYIGWPGDASKIGRLFTFAPVDQIAQTIGAGDLDGVLEGLLKAAKGEHFDSNPTVVLIGHSLGGMVLERAMLRLLNRTVDELGPSAAELPAPADLTLLLNAAASASQARPFLEKLASQNIHCVSGGHDVPLLVSMTSDGDVVTKLTFPGGKFISPDRPVTVPIEPPDRFGQTNTLAYNLLTAANMEVLRSHDIRRLGKGELCEKGITIPRIHRYDYCLSPIENAVNKTPYWIMGMPQALVPDHGTIFSSEVIVTISALLAERGTLSPGQVNPETSEAAPASPPPQNDSAGIKRAAKAPPVTVLRKGVD